MKKLLFFLSLLLITNYRLPVTILAYDPVIIDDAIHLPPPQLNPVDKDDDYHPNDIETLVLGGSAIKCSDTISITNKFEPKQSGINSNSQPTYQPYDVNEIKTMAVFGSDLYSNRGLDLALAHLANRATKVTGDLATLQKGFHSFDLNSPFGTSNVANRGTPYRIITCQKGQRLVKAVQSLSPTFNDAICNEQIAWSCSGDIFSVLEKKDGSGCTPIRLADIANALAAQKVFYDPNVSCYTNPQPIALPLSVPNPNSVSVSDSQMLLNNAVQVIDTCSNARLVEVYDKDPLGNLINRQIKKVSIPLGSVYATAENTVNQFISHKTKSRDIPLCETAVRESSKNRPNQVGLLVKVIRFFGTIIDQTQIFSDSTVVNFYIDPKEQKINRDETFLNGLITYRDQQKYQTTIQPGSSTNGVMIDPGIPITRAVFTKNLLPFNF
jgi:hypothetical protein